MKEVYCLLVLDFTDRLSTEIQLSFGPPPEALSTAIIHPPGTPWLLTGVGVYLRPIKWSPVSWAIISGLKMVLSAGFMHGPSPLGLYSSTWGPHSRKKAPPEIT
jgi:hypothetical protein